MVSSQSFIIIIFEMQNFNSNYDAASIGGQSSPRGQEDFQKIFHRLRDLHQVQDESRNELCPVFLDEESLIKARRESNWSAHQVATQVNILKQLEQTSQPTPHDDPTPILSSKRNSYNHLTDQDLRDSNRKLQEDNKKLFNECLRLRKMCRLQESKQLLFNKKTPREVYSPQETDREQENRALKQQIQDIKTQNYSLCEQIKSMQQQMASQRLLAQRYDKVCHELQQASRINEDLVSKIVNLERQLEAAVSRASSKSNQSISINNSTQQSRKTEVEKDRMITNMKIVHESQKLKLKNRIDKLQQELGKYRQTSTFSNVVSARKK